MTNSNDTLAMTAAPFRPESADVEVPVVWANNDANDFPLTWWNAMNERLVSVSMKEYENEAVGEHVVRLGVAMALSEVAARVANGTNPGGTNTDKPEPDQGKARAQKRLWGVMKREVKEAVGHARDLPFRDAAAAAYAPSDTGARKRLLGDAAYTAPQDRPKAADPQAVSDEVMQTQPVRRYARTRHAAEGGADNTHGGNRGMQRLDMNNVVRTTGNAFQGSTMKPAPGVRGGGVREEALTPKEHRQRVKALLAQLPEYADRRRKIPTRELFEALADIENTPTNKQLAERFGVSEDTVRRAIDRMRDAAVRLYGTAFVKAERAKQRRPKWWERRRRGWSFDYAIPKRGFTHTFVSLKTGEEVTARGQTLKPVIDAMTSHGYDRAGVEAIAFWAHKEFSSVVENPGQAPQVDFDDLDEVLDALPSDFVWEPVKGEQA